MANLPSRHEFMTNRLCTLDSCSICLLPFSYRHVAVRFTGSSSCNHVFGQQCIQKWLLSSSANANRCPTCRRGLYRAEEMIKDDSDDEIMINDYHHEPLIDNYHEEAFGDEGDAFSATSSASSNEEDDDDDEDDEEQFPYNLQDITKPSHANAFISYLATRLKESPGGRRRAGRAYRTLVRLACEHFGIRRYPMRRSIKWRQLVLQMGRLKHAVKRRSVPEHEMRTEWVLHVAEGGRLADR